VDGRHLLILDQLRCLNRVGARLLTSLRALPADEVRGFLEHAATRAELSELNGLADALTEWLSATYVRAVLTRLGKVCHEEGV
jgi:hypothetical protein